MESLIRWFTRNHVAANFFMVVILVMGIATWGTLKKEIFPETAIDAFSVSVPFPNATPEEIEKGVIVPIEEAIQGVDGIKRITSVANTSVGVVTVEVENEYEVRNVMGDAESRIDAIRNLAEEAEEPVIEELLIKSQVLSVAVSADTDERSLRRLAERAREDLLVFEPDWADTRIAQVTLAGARDYEISIEVSEDTLRQYGLTFDQVANAVRSSSLDLPGGSVRTPAGEIQIRTEQRRYTAEEFAPIAVVTRPDGSRVTLEEIALIRDAFEEEDISTRLDGRPALLLNVYRVGNQDTLTIAKLAKEYVSEVAPERFAEGVSLEIWRDDSQYLEGRMRLLAKNGFFGLILVFIVLALFLRPSLAGLVALGIPVSFAGAVALMPYTGISINLISLFAFILVLGIVVDDAIVVGENVYRRMRLGEHPREAAPKGTHEVGIVVIFGVITTAVAFTPMLGLSGVSGKIWPNIPLIVIPTLLFSLFQSKLILPSHLACLAPYDPDKPPGPVIRFQRVFSRGLERFVERCYRPVLRFCLHHRYVVLTGFFSVFAIVVSLVAFGWIKTQFFPEVEGDIISAKLEMARGTPFSETREAVLKLEAAAIRIREEFDDTTGEPIIRHMLTSAGTQPFITGNATGGDNSIPKGSHLGEVTLELQPAVNRKRTGSEIAAIWREYAGPIPGAVQLTFQAETAAGGNAIDLELTGNDLEELEAAAQEVKDALADYTGVIDIASSNRAGNREIQLEILPSAEALGLRLEDIARQVRQGFYGEEVQRLQRGRDEVQVFVRYPREERQSISQLSSMKIRTRDGTEVPFSEVAQATYGRGYASIRRSERRRAITITADVDKSRANANEVVAALTQEPNEWGGAGGPGLFARFLPGSPGEAKPEGVLTRITREYPGIQYTFQGEQKDQAESVSEMGQRALMAVLFMYVLMAIPLRSYLQPLIVMSVVPFGLVGAVLGHVLFGMNLSIMSMCGIIALAGVVVNDSLVLVDYVNREVARGHALLEAAWEAGAARFRPILLTSLTTFAGLTPMLLETDIQGRFLIPMAVSLAFGILFATAITLILIPAVYLILHDLLAVIQRKNPTETTAAEQRPAAPVADSASAP